MNEELPNSSQSTEEVTAVRGQYDHLFDPVPEPVVTEQEINSWPELQDYQRKWYAPVSAEAGQEARTGKGDGGRQPTPETEAEARDNISRLHDEKIKAVIGRHVNVSETSDQIMMAVRENQILREELARYFLAKIRNNPLSVPYRIAVNTTKSPNHTQYPHIMYSRDYAALLAISMLDGSFNKALSESKDTRPQYDKETKQYVTGQHQAAAEFLLFDHQVPT